MVIFVLYVWCMCGCMLGVRVCVSMCAGTCESKGSLPQIECHLILRQSLLVEPKLVNRTHLPGMLVLASA